MDINKQIGEMNDFIKPKGFTFNQAIASLSLLFLIVASFINLNIQVAELRIKVQNLEIGRDINAKNIESTRQDIKELRRETSDGFNTVVDKLDRANELLYLHVGGKPKPF